MISDYSPVAPQPRLNRLYHRLSFYEQQYQEWEDTLETEAGVILPHLWESEFYLSPEYFALRPPMGYPPEENSALPLWVVERRPLGFFTDETNLMAIATWNYPALGSPLYRPYPPVGEDIDEWCESLDPLPETKKWHLRYMAAAYAAGYSRMHQLRIALMLLNAFCLDSRGRPAST